MITKTFIPFQSHQQFVWKVLFLFFLLLRCMTATSYAQDEIIREIDQEIGAVEKRITTNEYYLNEYKINSNRFSLHSPGYFQYFERYYYLSDKANAKKNNSIRLKAVVTKEEKQEFVYLKKFIFDDQEGLIYYTERKSKVSKVPNNETRIYFKQGKLLRYMINNQDEIGVNTVPQDKIDAIISESTHYLQKFKERMQDIQYY